MLLNISVNNYASFDHFFIDCLKGKTEYKNQYVIDDQIIDPVCIYGSNGSGKSNALSIFDTVLSLMIDEPNETLTIPNIDKKGWETRETEILLNAKLGEDIFQYHLKITISEIVEESVLLVDKSLTTILETLLDRKNGECSVLGQPSMPVSSKQYSSLRKIGQEVYESSDKRNLLHRLYAYLSGIIFINCASGTHFHSSISKTNTLNDLMVSQSSFIEQFESHYPTFFPKYSLSKSKPTKENPNGYVIFHFKGENGNLGDRLFYPMPLVSSGIIAQTKVIANIAQADSDSLIVVDEIDNSLHTLVLKAFIEEIVNRKLQMIFVSHDTNLLSSFRPDQIYFANWKNGISSLKRLSIIYPGIREINNIEKMYLDGVFDKKIDE